jgi:F-box protein 21
MNSRLTQLPDEVIQVILTYLPPTSNVALQGTCSHFAEVANEPLRWKDYCMSSFRWWDMRHEIRKKISNPSFHQWKSIFATRYQTSQAVRHAIDNIVTHEFGRLNHLKVILDAGYDAKQHLLDLYLNASSSSNHLAQRYWSHAALGCLHRLSAVQTLMACQSLADTSVSLESSLSAFDLFILGERIEGDPDDVSPRACVAVPWLTLSLDQRTHEFVCGFRTSSSSRYR